VRQRPAAVAGRFYPADSAALATSVDALLAAARPLGRRPVALIAPHAGFQFSGAVAATAYAQLAGCRAEITRVIVLGPAHFVALTGMAVPEVDAFDTPLGPVPIDVAARQVALRQPAVTAADRPHAAEHAIEMQLPFLIRGLDADVHVLPVLVGRTAPEAVAGLLRALLTGPDTLAVVSTDLSHYLDRDGARRRDAGTAAAILARDLTPLRPADACGFQPLRGLLSYATARGLGVELLRLATSAEAGGDPRRVVGYGAFLLSA